MNDLAIADAYARSDLKIGYISPLLHTKIVEILTGNISNSFQELMCMNNDQYRSVNLSIQNTINDSHINLLVFKEIQPTLKTWFGTDDFLVQSNVYLRSSRPTMCQESECIGWHRESFYGSGMESAYNIWIPILGVNADNTLQFIPCSQNVSTDKLNLKNVDDKFTVRYSDGHKLGFLYSPKVITDGLDFTSALRMNVPEYGFACFPAELIHGAAINNSDHIRYSIDLRVIKRIDHSIDLSKSYHFASGKPYFISVD
tara:strand:- start:45 stop:815 length:771 start_codon:yes stop_codon:yes gene_type:complete